MKKKKAERLLEEKRKLEKKLKDKNLDFWVGLILIIFFFWTIIGLILGIIFFIAGISGKDRIEDRIARIEDKLDEID